MDCLKCLKKCKANCCGPVPFEKGFFESHKKVRKSENYCEEGDYIIAVDKDSYCVFLGKDLKCSVYEDRPYVCRKFGDESHVLMTCRYQKPNGQIRNKKQQRRIDKVIGKKQINSLISGIFRNK